MIILCLGFTILLLLNKHQVRGQVTCAQLKQDGDLTDGMKIINPEETDASGNIEVECDMTSDPEHGLTIIHHDIETRTFATGSSYKDAGSYVRTVNYNGITMEQIKLLIQKSASCEQYVKYECHGATVWPEDGGDIPYVWWVSRDGVDMFMWGGGKTHKKKCGCGINETCINPKHRCNCDMNDNRLRTDSGFLTDRERLPVTKIKIGDIDHSNEYSFFTIGALKCRGFAPPPLGSCGEVKAAGFTQTDSYLLDPDGDGEESEFWAYCDLDTYVDEVITVIFHDVPERTYVAGYTTYKKSFTYQTSDTMLRNLKEKSRGCQQHFDIDCYQSILSDSHWISINGHQMNNWGGHVLNGCPCSLTESCASGAVCNCNLNDATWREDAGYIVNTEELPMKEIFIGDVDGESEYAYFTIGPLECTGATQGTIIRGKFCYKIETKAVLWKEAESACRSVGAHLVNVNDENEDIYLKKLARALVGPMSSLWSARECATLHSNSTVSCETRFGYICKSYLKEYKSFKKSYSGKSSPTESLLASPKKAISSGVCSLYCEKLDNCKSFSYNMHTNDCKLSNEATGASAITDDGFDFYVLKKSYQKCSMHL